MSLVDEDPLRLIYGYVSHLKVPVWIKADSIQNCSACKQKMSTSDKHNCRLCGQVFCQQCTGKYHLPINFNINVEKKSGTCRVCYGCKEEHFQKRLKEQAAEIARTKGLSANEKQQLVKSLPNQNWRIKEIAPPESWQDEKQSPDCNKCRTKSSHNCRACGLMFCSKCTSKKDLPNYFEKKQKIGPMRCCDECRFRLNSGWQPVQKLSEGVDDEKPAAPGVKTCSIVGCREKPMNNGVCFLHASNASSGSSQSAPVLKPTISIFWEGTTSPIPLAKITIDPTSTLSQIDAQFKKLAPQNDAYSYIFKTDVILDSFWEQFTAAKLGQTLYIRKKFGGGLSAALLASATVVQPVQVGNRNPFKRTDNDILQANAGAEKPKFHRPAMVAQIKLNVPTSTNVPTIPVAKAAPTPGAPPSAAPAVLKPGQSIDDLLKSRAKLFVKQK